MDFFTKWLKRFPRAFFYAFAVASATLLGGAVPDLLGYAEGYWKLPENTLLIWQLVATFLGISFALVLTFIGLNKRIDARVYSVGEVNSSTARKGLILLISAPETYTPEAAQQGYEISFGGENPRVWGAPVKAILAHRTRLEHLWLISTDSSLPAANKLAIVVRQHLNGLQIHHGLGYIVGGDVNSDAAIEKTQIIARKIFSEENNLTDRMLVADITGATKPMTLGLAFACLDATRDIQYTYTDSVTDQTPTTWVKMFGFETRVSD
jgi:hypothetical protein